MNQDDFRAGYRSTVTQYTDHYHIESNQGYQDSSGNQKNVNPGSNTRQGKRHTLTQCRTAGKLAVEVKIRWRCTRYCGCVKKKPPT